MIASIISYDLICFLWQSLPRWVAYVKSEAYLRG